MELQTFSLRLKELRQKLKLTQKEFTKDLSITPATLSAYEKGTTNPSIYAITEIAEKYNISVDWLLGLSDNSTNKSSLETYAGLINLLVEIPKTGMHIKVTNEVKENKYYHYEKEYCDFEYECAITFVTGNSDFAQFFEDYGKMVALYEKGSIDEEVYNFSIEKTLNKFKDMVIGDCENELPF